MMYELTVAPSQLIVAFCRLHCVMLAYVCVCMKEKERERENREEEPRICLAKHRDEMIINGEREREEEKYRVTRAAM